MLKQYYWIDDQDSYISDNDANYSEVIEIKRLNFFIGKNNAGKSRFLRELFKAKTDFTQFQNFYLNELIEWVFEQTIKAVTIVLDGKADEYIKLYVEDTVEAINTNNKELAKQTIEKINTNILTTI